MIRRDVTTHRIVAHTAMFLAGASTYILVRLVILYVHYTHFR